MKLFTHGRAIGIGLALAGLLAAGAGCGGGQGTGGGGQGGSQGVGPAHKPLTKVTYRGPFVTTGADAPFYYAQKLGYYAEEGLDVQIRDSKGSSQAINDVSSGGSDFASAAATNVMLSVSQGQQVTSVATHLARSSFGFFVPSGSGITSIKDLKGRSIAVTGIVEPNMYAALSAAGLSKSDVKPVVADANALITTYLSGKVDAMYTVRHFLPLVTKRPSTVLMQSDVGFNPPDYALVVAKGTLESRPEIVRGFVRATLRGFQAAKRDPQAAVNALLAKHPELNPAQAIGTLRSVLTFLCAPAQAGQPYGENAAADWSTTAKALKRFAGLQGDTDGQRFIDNRLFDPAKGGGVVAGTC
jgi:NitT/TauT family transport system substrate-binding protein